MLGILLTLLFSADNASIMVYAQPPGVELDYGSPIQWTWTFYVDAVVSGHNEEFWGGLTEEECVQYCID